GQRSPIRGSWRLRYFLFTRLFPDSCCGKSAWQCQRRPADCQHLGDDPGCPAIEFSRDLRSYVCTRKDSVRPASCGSKFLYHPVRFILIRDDLQNEFLASSVFYVIMPSYLTYTSFYICIMSQRVN